MRFVDHQQRVGRQVVEQARRRLARRAAGEVARIVLDALAVADLGHHLDVELGALLQPLRLDQLVRAVQLLQPFLELGLDRFDRVQHGAARGHVMRAGVDGEARNPAQHAAGERVEQRQVLDLAVEQLDAHGLHLVFGREHVDHLAAHAVAAAPQFVVAALVLQFGQPAQQLALVEAIAAHQVQHHLEVLAGVAEAVDGRHGGDDQRVATLDQRLGRRQPHLFDVLVDAGVLLDVRVARRHVRFRLVVVVVADEIFHRVVREEFLELAVELRGERLVRRQHEGGFLDRLDDVGDGERLARAGDAEQGLRRQAGVEALDQAPDRLGLVAGGGVGRFELETIGGHGVAANRRL